MEEKIDNLANELRGEFKTEIKEIHKALLEIANKPINIYNQISLAGDRLEIKIIELIDHLIELIKYDNNLKSDLKN